MVLRRLRARSIAASLTAFSAIIAMGALPAIAAPSGSPSGSPTGSASSPPGAASSSGPASPAPGGEQAGGPASPGNAVFGLQPANAQSVDSRPYFSYAATPGSRVTDNVAVVNVGNDALPLAVYATDARSTPSGDITFLTADEQPTGAGAWVALSGGLPTIDVPGRTEASGPGVTIIPFTITVPADAQPGDHVAAVMASLKVRSTNSQGSSVDLDQRVAMRLYIRVSGDISPKLVVENLKITYRGTVNPIGSGAATVTYRIRNAGDILLGATQSISVEGLVGGTTNGPVPPEITALLPGNSVEMRVEVPDVMPSLRLTATVELRPKFALSADSRTSLSQVIAKASVWAMPWVLMLIVVAVIAALVLLTVRFFHRRGQGGGAHSRTRRTA